MIPALIAIGIVLGALVAARVISAWAHWWPAGPIALLAAAPAIPNVAIGAHLSADDLLPFVGLALLVWRSPRPTMTSNLLLRVALAAVAAATVARIASSIANGTGTLNVGTNLILGIGRPVFLVVAAVCVAMVQPPERRRRFVTTALAAMGSLEAAFGLIAFAIPLPGGIGVQPLRLLETLGGCASRITGTLGLSPNHVGAVFVLTMPLALAMAVTSRGWQRWMWAGAAGVQAAALVFTFTRASIILAALASLGFLLYHRQWKVFIVALAVSIGIIVSISVQACDSSLLGGRSQPGQPGGSAPGLLADRFSDANDRPALWYSAARLMVDHPLFGVGLGRSLEAMATNPAEYVHTPYGTASNSAHNTILLAGAETGLLGAFATLVLNLALAFGAMAMIWRPSADRILASAAGFSILAFLAQGMVNNLLTVPATSILLALLFGAFASTLDRPRPVDDEEAAASTYTRPMPTVPN